MQILWPNMFDFFEIGKLKPLCSYPCLVLSSTAGKWHSGIWRKCGKVNGE